MAHIQDIEGMQYARSGPPSEQQDYSFFNQQYATSTHQIDHNMFPSLIIQPKADSDVIKAVNWARQNNISVAVKSGGHQYSGASSTGGKNIQIDLSNTYKDMMLSHAAITTEKNRVPVLVGVSNHLMDFNAYLNKHGLFVPHGQCAYVCVGGHGQTGGYGQLGRSFGLFGDHIAMIRMVCHDGVIREISKASDKDLFYGILGGSPGNFGIITHYLVECHQAKDYLGTVAGPKGFKGPHGIKGLWLYSPKVLTKLLTDVAQMADDPTVPRNFDLCVSVLSTDFPIATLFPELNDDRAWKSVQTKIKNYFEDKFLDFLEGAFPAVIVLYAQWVPLSPDDKYDALVDRWFQRFRDMNKLFEDEALQINDIEEDMSKMTGEWIFPNKREFDLPYVKRTYVTSSRTLVRDRWVNNIVDRIDHIYNPKHYLDGKPGEKNYERYLSCKLSVQIQNFGGDNSKFYTNRDNGTSYSWRDSTMCTTLDCFHKTGIDAKNFADDWAAKNDALMAGPGSSYSRQDKRVLWGSWGDWNMADEAVWKTYYEDKAKYENLGKIRAKADPNGTFTANPFAVSRVG
jgi:hypothetical protein